MTFVAQLTDKVNVRKGRFIWLYITHLVCKFSISFIQSFYTVVNNFFLLRSELFRNADLCALTFKRKQTHCLCLD